MPRDAKELRKRSRRRDGSLDGELTEREFDVLRLLVDELSTRQITQSLYVLNLTLDFGFIERAAAGAPRYMQWYGAFGLMLSLIWIYVSVLRLLVLLRSRQ